MTAMKLKANQLIQHFGKTINSPLSLKNGVCALYDANQQESAIIEVPDMTENFIFHCTLTKLTSDPSKQLLRKLLLLNFEISAMQGCWIAIDENDHVCLCHTLCIEKTDEQNFCDTLIGFINHAKDVRLFVKDLLESTKENSLTRPSLSSSSALLG